MFTYRVAPTPKNTILVGRRVPETTQIETREKIARIKQVDFSPKTGKLKIGENWSKIGKNGGG
jgi:hypothetical protein